MPDMVFSGYSDQCSVMAEKIESDVADEPALGLPEVSKILSLLTNIVLEGRYTQENGRHLLHLIGDVKNLVEMNQSLRALFEKFNQVIAAGTEWICDE